MPTENQEQNEEGAGTELTTQATQAPKLLPQEEVNRIVAKEVAKANRQAAEKLKALEAQASETEKMRARLEELEGKDATASEKAQKLYERREAEWKTREAELLRTTEAIKSRADQDAISAAVTKVVAAKVKSENSPDVVQREIARCCKRKDDGSVVYVDPETDEELQPEKALEAYLSSHRVFLVAPPQGSGTTPGAPPGRKPISAMTAEELESVANEELEGRRRRAR